MNDRLLSRNSRKEIVKNVFTVGQLMRPTFRLVPDFIVPHLNKLTYGSHLHWEDKKNGSFKISRIHQSSEMWNEQCIEVYKAWSIKKKLWKVDDPKRITKAKHRLITALRRNPEIEMLKKESTFYRFRIIHPQILDRGKANYGDLTNEKNIDTTVREHDNEIKKSAENTEVSDMTNVFEVSKENIDSSFFDCSETTINSTYYPFSQSELYDNASKMFPISDVFDDELCTNETKSTGFSDRCCCDVLLDNYLCNQKCIWHGMPP